MITYIVQLLVSGLLVLAGVKAYCGLGEIAMRMAVWLTIHEDEIQERVRKMKGQG